MKLSLSEIHALNTGKADKALVEKAKKLNAPAKDGEQKAEKPEAKPEAAKSSKK